MKPFPKFLDQITPSTSIAKGIYCQPDVENNRLAIALYTYNSCAHRWELLNQLFDESNDHIFVYPDYRISHDDYNNKKKQKPHKVTRSSGIPMFSQITCMPSYYNKHRWCDLTESNNTTLGTCDDARDSLSATTLRYLQNLNFDTWYYDTNPLSPNKHEIASIRDLFEAMRCVRSKCLSKNSAQLFSELSPMSPDKHIEIVKNKNGVIFRFRGTNGSFAMKDSNEEYARVVITNEGTVSQNFVNSVSDDGVAHWGMHNRPTVWFYSTIKGYAKELLDLDYDNLFEYNPKFKYINSFIKKNIIYLLNIVNEDVGRSFNPDPGLLEFLRIAKKYPVLVDTLIKTNNEWIFFTEQPYTFSVYAMDRAARNPEIKQRLDQSIELANKYCPFIGNEYKTTNYHQDNRSYECPTYLLKKFTAGALTTRYLGFLDPTASKFYDSLGLTREQWNYVLSLVNKETNSTEKHHILYCVGRTKIWFLGHNGYDKDNGCYQAYDTGGIKPGIVSMKQVPLSQFQDVLDTVIAFSRSTTIRENSYMGKDFISYACDARYEGDPVYSREAEDKFKLTKWCLRRDTTVDIYTDYVNMRSACIEGSIDGFVESDWPLHPKEELVGVFHDRIVELYNEMKVKKAEQESTEKQCRYSSLLPQYLHFNYEEDNDSRCVVVPKKITELIIEGQRLDHCVGSYMNSVAQGKEVILFLRNKTTPDTPYATIDIYYDKQSKLWKARQIHTAHNRDITEEDKDFLKRWAKTNNIDEETIHTHYGMMCAL